jgi:hypothetical protein
MQDFSYWQAFAGMKLHFSIMIHQFAVPLIRKKGLLILKKDRVFILFSHMQKTIVRPAFLHR